VTRHERGGNQVGPRRARVWWRRIVPIGWFVAPFAIVIMAVSSASAATLSGTPVPVAGVDAFGIGVGQLGSPGSLVTDSKGDLFAVDASNNRVLEYAYNAGTGTYAAAGTIIAGGGGAGAGSTQLELTGQVYESSQVALDANGDLFVADTGNNRVQEYVYNSTTGAYAPTATTVAGVGGAGSGVTQLRNPSGVALDANGDLFVADTGNNRVQEYVYNSTTGAYAPTATTVAGVGGTGSGLTQLNAPTGLALDPRGDLFAIDALNGRVLEYAVNSSTGSYTTTASAIASGFTQFPRALAFDGSGDLLAAYSYLGYGGVSEFAYNATTRTFTGSGVSVDAGDMVGPMGIAVDSHGDLFVSQTAQTSNPSQTVWNMVMEFSYTASTDTFAPAGTVLGQVGRQNEGISTMAVDGHGDLFVAAAYSPSSGVYEFPFNATTGTYSPLGTLIGAGSTVAVDTAGDVFTAGSGGAVGVLEYSRNAITGTYPATGVAVPGATQLSQLAVGALALDSRNDLFVATTDQVLEFAYNSITGSYGASGTVVAGVGGVGVGPTQLAGVGGIGLDTSGDLFVSDPANSRVQEYLLNSTSGVYSASGTTVAGVGGNGSGLNQLAGLSVPVGSPVGGVGAIVVDQSGDLFAYDTGNARVMEYAGNSTTAAYAANGTPVYSEGRDNWPEQGGVAVDARGDLFFNSNYNSAVLYELAAASTSTATPSVSSLAPTTGPAAGGTPVTISGTNLAGGTVNFGSTPATGVSCTAGSCAATAPAGTGTVNVTVTTTAGTSATSSADQFSYQAPPATANLLPDPGFETAGVPTDYWGSTVVRSQAVVHSGSWSLAQTTKSTSGGWDLDSNRGWYALISSGKTYTASIWVRATATVKVDVSLDLLNASGTYLDSGGGSWVTLVANTWTRLAVTGITPVSSEIYGGMEPNFSNAIKGTVIYWDDMSITSN
jgi:hypothetical protein